MKTRKILLKFLDGEFVNWRRVSQSAPETLRVVKKTNTKLMNGEVEEFTLSTISEEETYNKIASTDFVYDPELKEHVEMHLYSTHHFKVKEEL